MRSSTQGAVVLGALVMLGQVGPAAGASISIAITAEVRTLDDPDGVLGSAINVGDTLTGLYTYESSTPDTSTRLRIGDYSHTTPPYGITVESGGLKFGTDPDNVNFLVEILNDAMTALGARGTYLVNSVHNIFDIAVPFATENHISWQLDDPEGGVLSSTVLPTQPPVLKDWQSIFGLTILSENRKGGYFLIRADVTSAKITNAQ